MNFYALRTASTHFKLRHSKTFAAANVEKTKEIMQIISVIRHSCHSVQLTWNHIAGPGCGGSFCIIYQHLRRVFGHQTNVGHVSEVRYFFSICILFVVWFRMWLRFIQGVTTINANASGWGHLS